MCVCIFAERRNGEASVEHKTRPRRPAESQTAAGKRAGKSTTGEEKHGETQLTSPPRMIRLPEYSP